MSHTQLARYTQIDYDREMAFIAVGTADNAEEKDLGVVRTITDAFNESAEFAIVIRSDLKGKGLGFILLEKMVRYCRERGLQRIVGQVLSDNAPMLNLAKRLGFKRTGQEGGIVEVELKL